MKYPLVVAALGIALISALISAVPARAQSAAPSSGASNPGRDLVQAKCFQCHTDTMFRDGRQDRRAWEAAIYRMVGRGGLWTADEIKTIADYLGAEFGPDAKPAAAKP
jgi:mono/diheme cytochrome c family protein